MILGRSVGKGGLSGAMVKSGRSNVWHGYIIVYLERMNYKVVCNFAV